MSETNQAKEATVVKPEPLTTTHIEVDRNEVTAIVVAGAERDLRAKRKVIETEIKAIETQKQNQATKANKELDTWVTEVGTKEFSSVLTALKAYKPTIDVQMCGHADKKETHIELEVTITGDRVSLNATFVILKPAFINKNAKEAEALQKLISEKQAMLVEIRRAITDLPSLERQVRATIAEQALAKSVDGREILKSIKGIPALEYLS